MKREKHNYSVTEITYTVSRDEVIAAVCQAHNINLPRTQDAYQKWEAFDLAEGGLGIRLRFEAGDSSAAPQESKP